MLGTLVLRVKHHHTVRKMEKCLDIGELTFHAENTACCRLQQETKEPRTPGQRGVLGLTPSDGRLFSLSSIFASLTSISIYFQHVARCSEHVLYTIYKPHKQ